MAKKTIKSIVNEIKSQVQERTGKPCPLWLTRQIEKLAINELICEKVANEILDLRYLTKYEDGSTGQKKNEMTPLLPMYDKLQNTLMRQYRAVGLNYDTTPSKVEGATNSGEAIDPLFDIIEQAKID